jgi:glycosyltransferase involved in cell wall biosynthesis
MKLSVIIPCYNEVRTIERVIAAVHLSPHEEKEIIVVDDYSNDGTRELIGGVLRFQVDAVLLHDRNQGKGAAIRTGVKAATGDVVIVQDADLEYSPAEYPLLIGPIERGDADVVYGSRFITGKEHRVLFFWHSVGNKLLTLLSNMMTNLNLSDMETGYKAFKREIIQKIEIQENRFGFEPEITAKIARLKLRIFEVGISYKGRTYEEGKKINWKDGIRALYCIIKYNVFAPGRLGLRMGDRPL